MYPFALFEADRTADISRYLIGEDAHPNTDDAPMEDITANISEDGSNNGNADHRTFCGVSSIAGSAETTHVDNLGNLEQNRYDDYV